MGQYLIRRSLFMILVLFLVSVLTFLIFMKLPSGDPARMMGGQRTNAEDLQEIRENLGLDQPFWVQYGRFAKGMIPWPGLWLDEQIYYSYSNNVAIKEEIYPRLPYTFALAMGAAVIWLAIGIPVGIISAIKRRSFADRTSMIFALIGVSAPVFWLAYLFLYLFWFKLGIAPPSGIPSDEGVVQAMVTGRFVMPWIVLSLAFAAFYSRMTRGNLIETMGEDYIRTARAKGLSERKVIFKHGLRSALTPVVTMFGMDLGILFGGVFITETLFNIPGLGQYAVRAIGNNDIPAVMTVVTLAAAFIVVLNLIVDVMYAVLDPRVRYR